MKRLVIDDVRTPFEDDETVYARTLGHGTREVTKGWDELYLDHDLGYERGVGTVDIRPLVMRMVKAAVNGKPFDVGEVHVISANPIGARWIADQLAPYYNVVEVVAYPLWRRSA